MDSSVVLSFINRQEGLFILSLCLLAEGIITQEETDIVNYKVGFTPGKCIIVANHMSHKEQVVGERIVSAYGNC